MPAAPLPDALRLLAPLLNERLGGIFAAIQGLVAHHFLRIPAFSPLILPLWQRLNRARHCLARLTARIHTGRPLPRSRAGRLRAPRPARHPAAPGPAIPRTHAWLLKALGWHVGGYRNQLEVMLAEPAMAELIAAAPGLGRILRPLCHMLMLPPPSRPPGRAPQPPPAPPCEPAPAPQAAPQAAVAPPVPAYPSPFRSLTLRREPYICTHQKPA